MLFRYNRASEREDDKNKKNVLNDSIVTLTSKGGIMKILNGKKIFTYTLEELLGPLNDVEKKYAPKKLHVSGSLPIPLPGPRLSVIGSREASIESLNAVKKIVKTLVRNEAIVVSGLAKGIDTKAHRSTIEEGGYTIAVLGTPLDQVYPKENFKLQDIIMCQHLAISQFPSGHQTRPRDFVMRNRTMALISDASIIVEAGDSSGSLHQGWEALRLGRPLFIWNALMNNSSLSWPKKMLEYGAIELFDPEEIFEFIPTHEGILNLAL